MNQKCELQIYRFGVDIFFELRIILINAVIGPGSGANCVKKELIKRRGYFSVTGISITNEVPKEFESNFNVPFTD